MKVRTVRLWYKTHKWTSLICTALLLVACVTGLPLVFHEELDDWLMPHVHPVAGTATQDAPVDAMVTAAQKLHPDLHPYSVAWDDDEPRVLVIMTPGPKPGPNDFRTVAFDQHTGKTLEEIKSGTGPMAWMLRLHAQLFMGLGGQLLMGAMALLFVVAVVTGVLVYGPFMRRLDFGTYRRNAARRTRWFDLHNLLGIVVFAWMFVVGATGVMNALSAPLFGLWRMQVLPPLLKPFHGKPTPTQFRSVDKTVEEARAALPGMRMSSVLFPNPVIASPRHYVVFTMGVTPVTSRLASAALVDVETGQMMVAKDLPLYLRALEVSRPLHFGDYGGMPLKVLWALFDVVTIVVLLSGVYLWMAKRSSIEAELDRIEAAA